MLNHSENIPVDQSQVVDMSDAKQIFSYDTIVQLLKIVNKQAAEMKEMQARMAEMEKY
jgi:hypothetical protein